MANPETQFLHERNPNLHSSQEVEGVVSYLRAGGEAIPNEPADKIAAYLGLLADREYVNDGILTGDEASIDRQIDAHVIKPEDVPEGYFELQRRIAREQGHGDVAINQETRDQMVEAIRADQRVGLGKWVEYLGGEDGGYPDWFKFYTFGSVTKLGGYDKERGEFLKRSKGTTAPYPELNREALAYVYDVINKSRIQGEKIDGEDPKLQSLLKSANFGNLYAHAVLEVTPTSPELRKEVKGSWTKFNQSSDPRTARRLSGSLQGYGTSWCTAGESTASTQLANGDFYVYYTRDEDGKDSVPRVAIRMQEGNVAEVRGVNAAQELEPEMADIASEQLKDLPGGEEYIRRAEDMKRLTAIDKKLAADPTVELSPGEIRFLYEFDHEIQGFGYERDPRVAEIRSKRGEMDYVELKKLLTESLHEQTRFSHGAYRAIGDQVNEMRRRSRIDIIDPAEFENAFSSKMEQWEKDGSLEWSVRQIVEHGGRITLVAAPNEELKTDEVIKLAEIFGKGQPYETYVNRELYGQYSGAELSGPVVSGSRVKFSLISSGLDHNLDGTVVQQQDKLKEAQITTPSLKVPSVVEAITYWQTLRARGDKLADSTAYYKTLIRYFNLDVKGRLVPSSGVPDDGGPGLYYSPAGNDDSARFAVG